MLSIIFNAAASVVTANRRHTIDVHELDLQTVQSYGRHIRPFKRGYGFRGNPSSTERTPLDYTRFRLWHATIKAELLADISPTEVCICALGDMIKHFNMFVPGRDCRLSHGYGERLDDFSATGLSGRLGQGMALLFLESKQYIFVERMRRFIDRLSADPANVDPRSGRRLAVSQLPDRSPDFVLENGVGDTVLAEAKGMLARPGVRSPIKEALRDGLNQLHAWRNSLSPAPAKSFALATCFREENDGGLEPSLLSFVDPPGDEFPSDPLKYEPGALRAGNYSGWLRLMSLGNAADALLADKPRKEHVQIQLSSITVPTENGQREYVFTVIAADMPSMWYPWPSFGGQVPENQRSGASEWILVAGIELATIRRIEQAVQSSGSSALLELPSLSTDAIEASAEGFAASVLGDGTFLAVITWEWLSSQRLALHSFHLG